MLKPFFSYYGSKWRVAPHYPAPEWTTIVEPFAGSAGYSMRHPDRLVELYDIDEVVVGVWDYLINTPEREIAKLPLDFGSTDELTQIPQEARWLIGFWLNKGTTSPRKSPSLWMRSGHQAYQYWGPEIRERITSQVGSIRHWSIKQADYCDIPNFDATWFVDAPYQGAAGRMYRNTITDYDALAHFCRERYGQVIVCEKDGADWLPFEDFRTTLATAGARGGGYSKEVIWTPEGS